MYKKVLIDYEQSCLINVVLNEQMMDLKKITVFFNGRRVVLLNRQYSTFRGNRMASSVHFEVTPEKQNNYLELFFEQSDGRLFSYDTMIQFEKGFILNGDDFVTKPAKVFFIATDRDLHEADYQVEVSNENALQYIDRMDYRGKVYFKLRTENPGISVVKVSSRAVNSSIRHISRVITVTITD